MQIERLLAVYQRDLSGESSASAGEQELLFIFDREHDMLLRGELVNSGAPPKPLLATIVAIFRVHSPSVPVAVHTNCPTPLREVAKLRPLPGYITQLPRKEESFDNCPCWNEADMLNISMDEFTNRVRNIFIVYAPEKLPGLNDVVKKHGRKRKGGLLQMLVSKYGPEPTDEHAAAVLKLLEREKKFADIVSGITVGTQGGGGGGVRGEGAVPLTQLMKSLKRSNKKDELLGLSQPLYFSTVLLASQPSGGYGRLHIRLRPVPYLELQQSMVGPFKRRPLDVEHEFWYLCNEGHVLSFDTSQEALAPFVYRHGDRVLSTWGVTRGRWSTVIGVRDGTLWVHDDGDVGCSALVGFKSRDELERCNGWIMHENVSNRLTECTKLLVMCNDGTPRWMHIAPELLYRRFGFYHGDVVAMSNASCTIPFDGVAVIVGVSVEDETALYVYFVDPNVFEESSELQLARKASAAAAAASPSSSRYSFLVGGGNNSGSSLNITRIQPSRYYAQPLKPRCMTSQDVQKQYAWKTVGCAKVLQYMPQNSSAGDVGKTSPGVIFC
jgi:hypothetical protein